MEKEIAPLSAEELTKISASKTLSDAELIKGGATIDVDELGNQKNLFPTPEQLSAMKDEMEKELANKKIREIDELLKSKFSKKFLTENEQEMKRVEKEYGHSGEQLDRVFVIRSLRAVFHALGYRERSAIHYKEEGNKSSDRAFRIDTINIGTFDVDVKLNNSDVVIKVAEENNRHTPELEKDLEWAFNSLKKMGVFVSIIFLANKKEIRSFNSPDNSPDNPPTLPPAAKIISEEEWREINERYALIRSNTAGYAEQALKELSARYWDWPRFGAKGLRTKNGVLNGALIFCDGKIAIFDTPEGKIEIPFKDLLDPFNYDYGGDRERREKRSYEDNHREQQNDSKPKAMAMPYPSK